jgi:hypothetical protein
MNRETHEVPAIAFEYCISESLARATEDVRNLKIRLEAFLPAFGFNRRLVLNNCVISFEEKAELDGLFDMSDVMLSDMCKMLKKCLQKAEERLNAIRVRSEIAKSRGMFKTPSDLLGNNAMDKLVVEAPDNLPPVKPSTLKELEAIEEESGVESDELLSAASSLLASLPQSHLETLAQVMKHVSK